MKITLKDGSIKEYAEAMSAYDIARDISEGLARAACAVPECRRFRHVLSLNHSLSLSPF